jgi:hypothetical protein
MKKQPLPQNFSAGAELLPERMPIMLPEFCGDKRIHQADNKSCQQASQK